VHYIHFIVARKIDVCKSITPTVDHILAKSRHVEYNEALCNEEVFPMPNKNDMRLAVLIDADNAPRTQLKSIMEEIAVHGTPTVKRIYGDWTSNTMDSWKDSLLHNAITPIQQYGYTKGKNSTDSAMIIDAMDILYSERVDGFCIVSSDSDFTRLATRLREAGMKVIGIGERKTPSPFIAACDKFIYIEIIRAAHAPKGNKPKPRHDTRQDKPAAQAAQAEQLHLTRDIIDALIDTIEDVADEDGWAYLGEVGTLLLKKQPSFDSRNYGFSKLTQLIQAIDDIEMEFRPNLIANNGQLIYVRTK